MQATLSSTLEDERRIRGAQLAGLGIRLLNRYGRLLECETCGATWSPEPARDGGLPRGFWRCPNRCNW
jgi:hypothetical protein